MLARNVTGHRRSCAACGASECVRCANIVPATHRMFHVRRTEKAVGVARGLLRGLLRGAWAAACIQHILRTSKRLAGACALAWLLRSYAIATAIA